MATTVSSGTQTATLNTDHTLYTTAALKTCVLSVDLGNLASGDTVEIRISGPVLSGGTGRIITTNVYSGTQSDPGFQSPALILQTGSTFIIRQTTGGGRAFPWRVDTLD